MRKIFLAAFCASALGCAAITPEQSGGIYFAYPYTTDSVAPVPEGLEPVYISHYGRHGSRWAIDFSMYDFVEETLKKAEAEGNLTEAGRKLLPLVEQCDANAQGHSGELSPLGSRQHKAIARRMVARYPGLFEATDSVVMRSSTVPRCIVSMSAFSEGLRECSPELAISRAASPGDMKFINYSTAAARKMGDGNGEWHTQVFYPLRNATASGPATAARIFKDPSKVENSGRFVRNLHDIAIAVQNVDGLDSAVNGIFDVFAPCDIESIWAVTNYMMCMRHSNATPGAAVGPACAVNLLRDIIDRADAALASREVSADFRFGHDTALIRLLSLADIEGCSPVGVSTPEEVAGQWKSYEVSPMAANLRIVLFCTKDGEIIANLHHNERQVGLNCTKVKNFAPGFYRWEDLKNYWNYRIKTFENE